MFVYEKTFNIFSPPSRPNDIVWPRDAEKLRKATHFETIPWREMLQSQHEALDKKSSLKKGDFVFCHVGRSRSGSFHRSFKATDQQICIVHSIDAFRSPYIYKLVIHQIMKSIMHEQYLRPIRSWTKENDKIWWITDRLVDLTFKKIPGHWYRGALVKSPNPLQIDHFFVKKVSSNIDVETFNSTIFFFAFQTWSERTTKDGMKEYQVSFLNFPQTKEYRIWVTSEERERATLPSQFK